MVHPTPRVLTQFPSKNSLPRDSPWSRMLTHFWDVPKRISKDEVSKVLFYFYLSIRFSYFIDKMEFVFVLLFMVWFIILFP